MHIQITLFIEENLHVQSLWNRKKINVLLEIYIRIMTYEIAVSKVFKFLSDLLKID